MLIGYKLGSSEAYEIFSMKKVNWIEYLSIFPGSGTCIIVEKLSWNELIANSVPPTLFRWNHSLKLSDLLITVLD